MIADDAEVFRKVVGRLSKTTAPQYRAIPITEDTEVYGDLRIYGDDLVELVWWLEKQFGVQTNIDPFKYAPGESAFFGVWRGIGSVFSIKPKYESLKVRDVLAAIQAKRWPDDASS
jgi:hypothetical protein